MEQTEKKVEISSKDLSNASHIFARTINLLLEESEGIVIDKTPDMNFEDGITKVIVFKHQNMIHIQKFDQDLEEGSLLNLDIDDEKSGE